MSNSNQSKLSLPEVFARLFASKPPLDSPGEPLRSDERKTTSIRFPHDVHSWIHSQADHMGISVQAFVATTMKGVMHATESPETSELDLMLIRFFQLFREHGIGVADIPKFLLPETLSRSDLGYPDKILDELHDDQLSHLESVFGVTSEWLKGRSDQIYRKRSFYKSLADILAELVRHRINTGRYFKVIFLAESNIGLEELRKNRACLDSRDSLYVHVLVALDQVVDGVEFTTYQVWDSFRWDYAPTRLHAKALIYFCDKVFGSVVSGYNLKGDILDLVTSGKTFFSHLSGFRNRWTLDELVWGDKRNPELDELPSVESFFCENGGGDFLNALDPSCHIENREGFLSGFEWPRINDLGSLSGHQ